MKEYLDKNATLFKQFPSRLMSINPAVESIIKSSGGKRLLDVGCGDGYFYPVATESGFDYYGLDVSLPLLQKAKDNFPHGNFLQQNATNFARSLDKKFDLILIIMLFQVFGDKKNIVNILKQCNEALTKKGKIVIGTGHPCFDSYMQTGLQGRKDVLTNFTGYFTSPTPYTVVKETKGKTFEFHDYHWTLQDYFSFFKESHLGVIDLTECKMLEQYKHLDEDLYNRKKSYPTFIIFELAHINTEVRRREKKSRAQKIIAMIYQSWQKKSARTSFY